MFPFWLLVKVYVFTLVVMKIEQYSTLYFPLLIIIFNIFTFNSKALAQMQHKHSNSDKLKSIMNSYFSLEKEHVTPKICNEVFWQTFFVNIRRKGVLKCTDWLHHFQKGTLWHWNMSLSIRSIKITPVLSVKLIFLLKKYD